MSLPHWIRRSLLLVASATVLGTGLAQAATATPILNISDVSMAEGQAGATLFSFTVSLSQAAGTGGVGFSIATADGTATTANLDYLAMAADMLIAEGQSQVVFGVTVFGDFAVEPNESFFVNIFGLTGALGGDLQGQGTIVNDDAVTPPPPTVPEPATAWLVAGALAAAGLARRQRR